MVPVVMLILDGAGDTFESAAYARTPFEQAEANGLNELVARGHAAVLYPIRPGIEPETHSGMLNLLGYAFLPADVPRGPIEALGCGMSVQHGDLVLRANFGTRDESSGLIADRRVCRSLTATEAHLLCAEMVRALGDESQFYTFDMCVVRDYRACVVICSKSGALSDAISNTDPGYPTEDRRVVALEGFDPVSCVPLDESEAACRTARFVNDFADRAGKFLTKHQINIGRRARGEPLANVILTRGPGCSLPEVTSISQKYGRPFILLSDLPIESGVGVLVGCGFSGYMPTHDLPSTYSSLVERVMGALAPDIVVVVHVKGPDEFGHDGDFSGKTRCIELIDRHLVRPLVRQLADTAILIVTSDHATPCAARTHTADAVPFVVSGVGFQHNGGRCYTERECQRLNSPVKVGADLLPYVLGIHAEMAHDALIDPWPKNSYRNTEEL